jgi:hypothetical protein
MADRETQVIARIAPAVGSVDATAWDRLAGSDDPFLSHAFLSALEDSGSVGEGTGWTPAPILVEGEDGGLSAVAPAYLKTHSQGEYVFDHGWAEAFERAGGQYYPKLQVAVPFTPVPGRRLLGASRQALVAALEAVVTQNGRPAAFAVDRGQVPDVLDVGVGRQPFLDADAHAVCLAEAPEVLVLLGDARGFQLLLHVRPDHGGDHVQVLFHGGPAVPDVAGGFPDHGGVCQRHELLESSLGFQRESVHGIVERFL